MCIRIDSPVVFVDACVPSPEPRVSVSIARNNIISKPSSDTSMVLGDLFFNCACVGVAWLWVAASQPWTLLLGCYNVCTPVCKNMRSGLDASTYVQVEHAELAFEKVPIRTFGFVWLAYQWVASQTSKVVSGTARFVSRIRNARLGRRVIPRSNIWSHLNCDIKPPALAQRHVSSHTV